MDKKPVPLFTKDEVKKRIAALRAAGVALPDYNLACFIADNAQVTQVDKAGRDYALHTGEGSPSHTDSLAKRCIYKLHDLLEDTDWTVDDLREVGFSERIVNGVDGMTKRDGELYFDFIVRCASNPDSLDGKLRDLKNNMSLFRNNFILAAKDTERINKYIIAYNYLVAIKRGRIKVGTSVGDWMEKQEPELQDWALLNKNTRSTTPPPAPEVL